MSRSWAAVGVVVFGFGAMGARAQVAVVDATACDISAHPSRFDGKMVRIKGATVQVGFESFLVRGASCSSPVWLSYPAGTKGKAGPAAVVTLQLASGSAVSPGLARPALQLARNKDFETFDALLSAKGKTPGMCLGCVRNDVTATLVGRVDGSDNPGLQKDASGKVTGLDGFGNMNMYGARLVLQSVSDVMAVPIDFGKIPTVKDDNSGMGGGKDYGALTKKAEGAFDKGNAAIATIERALAALGAPGVDNGVGIAFDGFNEVPAGEGTKGASASPDGLLLTIHLNGDVLKGDSMSRAVAHEGAEVASLRETPLKGNAAILKDAWQTTLLVVIGARQKTLTLPGGILLWNTTWPATESTVNATDALDGYLNGREQTPR